MGQMIQRCKAGAVFVKADFDRPCEIDPERKIGIGERLVGVSDGIANMIDNRGFSTRGCSCLSGISYKDVNSDVGPGLRLLAGVESEA